MEIIMCNQASLWNYNKGFTNVFGSVYLLQKLQKTGYTSNDMNISFSGIADMM